MKSCLNTPPKHPSPEALRPAKRFGLKGSAVAVMVLFAALTQSRGASPQFATFEPLARPAASTNAAPPAASSSSGDDASAGAMDSLDNQYKLAIGDHIDFQVLEDEDAPKTLPVMDSGDVEVPYIGRFPAAGKTCKELAQQLKLELQKKYYYRATVIITVESKISRGIIYLVGAIRTPGPLEIPRDDTLTVSKAILRAGGFTDTADSKHVRVTRKQEGTNDVFTLDVSQILEKGKTQNDRPVLPGDLIYVPERVFRF